MQCKRPSGDLLMTKVARSLCIPNFLIFALPRACATNLAPVGLASLTTKEDITGFTEALPMLLSDIM